MSTNIANKGIISLFKEYIKRNAPLILILKDRATRTYYSIINPKKYLEKIFLKEVGYPLNLNNPTTYNEKLQWLKLYWHDPRLTICSDKYAVREYVKSRGLGHLLNDVIGIYDNANDINLDTLPDKFVLKAVHGSGWNIICADKSKLNWKHERTKLTRWLKDNYYYHGYEWGYLHIRPKIICEKFIDALNSASLMDYKIFCFDGEPKFLYVASDRNSNQTKFDFYTCDWKHLPVKNHYPNSSKALPKPEELDHVLSLSRILAADFPHVRVDFYIESGQIIFGEMTFFHMCGLHKFEPQEYDGFFGSFLRLPDKLTNV